MTAISAPTSPKLPIWQTVRASYAIVGRNFRQLVRICWVWVLIMIPVYMALDLARGDLARRFQRGGPLVARDRRGAAEPGRYAVPGIDRGCVAPVAI